MGAEKKRTLPNLNGNAEVAYCTIVLIITFINIIYVAPDSNNYPY